MRRSSDDSSASSSDAVDFGFGCSRHTEDWEVVGLQPRLHTISGTSARSLRSAQQSRLSLHHHLPGGGVMHTVPIMQTPANPPIPPPPSSIPPPVVPPVAPITSPVSRRPHLSTTTIRKQDSIAEEPSLVPDCDGCGEPLSHSPSPLPSPSTSHYHLDSPHTRKRSLSPSFGVMSMSVSTNNRRRRFQREVSAAHSDVTEVVSRKHMIDAATSPIPPAHSYENNLQIRFDIGSGSSLAKSTSSSLCRRQSRRRKQSVMTNSGRGSLVANGFLPSILPRSTASHVTVSRHASNNTPMVTTIHGTHLDDPSRWRFSNTKQRSCSESAFFNAVDQPRPLGLQDRRCSVSMLNPHKEHAILRKILGPNGLSWLNDNSVLVKRDQVSRKSFSLAPGDDPEAGGGGGCGKGGGGGGEGDDAMTPLVKEREQGGRLIHRQLLFQARRITSDYALLFATFGIVLMIIENEMSAAHVYNKSSAVSHVLKSLILLSTGILLGLVIKFHVHEVQLFMNANSAEDWRIALTFRRCAQIALELIVCGICPLPLDLSFHWATVHSDGMTVTTALVPLDVLLSIPMFFRSYWICRVMLLHSRLFTDASSRSIAGLNRVTFNARFILKTLMTLCPGTMLMVFTASLWMAAAWVLRLCERHHLGDPVNSQALKHQNYLNSLWMIAITFLSVGYGDIVPVSHCGRAVAVITGILGTCTSSMVVAVIARKLELTRAEKHVHNFMIDTQLTKQLKHSAANVLRETWLIYKHRRLVDKIDPGKIRHHQRKFLMAIYGLRKVKRDQRKLAENSVSLGDVAKTTSNTYEMIHDVHSTQDGLALRMTAVEHQLSDIQREIGQLADLLRSSLRSNRSSGPDDSYASSNSEVRRRRTAAGID